MVRLAARRRPARPDGLAAIGVAVAGLAIGATLGFLLGEVVGPRAEGAIRSPIRKRDGDSRSVAGLVHDAQAALDADLRLRDLDLEIIPVGRDAVELRGWVPDRPSRVAAARLVTGALAGGRLVNRLLVRGEDDLGAPADLAEGEASA